MQRIGLPFQFLGKNADDYDLKPTAKYLIKYINRLYNGDAYYHSKMTGAYITSFHDENWRANNNAQTMIDFTVEPQYLMPLIAARLANETNFGMLLGLTKSDSEKPNLHIHLDMGKRYNVGYEVPTGKSGRFTSKKFDNTFEIFEKLKKHYDIPWYIGQSELNYIDNAFLKRPAIPKVEPISENAFKESPKQKNISFSTKSVNTPVLALTALMAIGAYYFIKLKKSKPVFTTVKKG